MRFQIRLRQLTAYWTLATLTGQLLHNDAQDSAYHRVLTQEVEHPTSSACAPNERDFAD